MANVDRSPIPLRDYSSISTKYVPNTFFVGFIKSYGPVNIDEVLEKLQPSINYVLSSEKSTAFRGYGRPIIVVISSIEEYKTKGVPAPEYEGDESSNCTFILPDGTSKKVNTRPKSHSNEEEILLIL